jgi:HPt (histidine-containing phosphotransfer) domain-containing protein
MTPKFFDPEALYSLLGDNKDTIAKMLENILKGAARKHATLQSNVDLKDWPIVKGDAHFLKSNFRYLGAKEMASLLKEIEHIAIEDDADKSKIPSLTATFYQNYPAIIEEVGQYLEYLKSENAA